MSNNSETELKFRWIYEPREIGEMLFTFDGKQIFNLFQDYPDNLTMEQKEMFDAANPFWVDFFKSRTNSNQ